MVARQGRGAAYLRPLRTRGAPAAAVNRQAARRSGITRDVMGTDLAAGSDEAGRPGRLFCSRIHRADLSEGPDGRSRARCLVCGTSRMVPVEGRTAAAHPDALVEPPRTTGADGV